MPPEHGLGLDQQQGVTPARYQASKEHEQTSLVGPERRPLDLASCHDELLAKQDVLRDELPARSEEVSGESSDQRQRTGEAPPAGVQPRTCTDDKGPKPTTDLANHGRNVARTG